MNRRQRRAVASVAGHEPEKMHYAVVVYADADGARTSLVLPMPEDAAQEIYDLACKDPSATVAAILAKEGITEWSNAGLSLFESHADAIAHVERTRETPLEVPDDEQAR